MLGPAGGLVLQRREEEEVYRKAKRLIHLQYLARKTRADVNVCSLQPAEHDLATLKAELEEVEKQKELSCLRLELREVFIREGQASAFLTSVLGKELPWGRSESDRNMVITESEKDNFVTMASAFFAMTLEVKQREAQVSESEEEYRRKWTELKTLKEGNQRGLKELVAMGGADQMGEEPELKTREGQLADQKLKRKMNLYITTRVMLSRLVARSGFNTSEVPELSDLLTLIISPAPK